MIFFIIYLGLFNYLSIPYSLDYNISILKKGLGLTCFALLTVLHIVFVTSELH